MTRALAAARLYLLNKWMLVWIPIIVIGAMIALTICIQLIVNAAGGRDEGVYFNGAFQAALWCIFGVAVSASTQMFPFAFALSSTRRDFLIGTLIAALGTGAGYGAIYALLAWVEEVTGGYWIGAHAFDLAGWVAGGPGPAFVLYGAAILFMFVIGFASAMLFKRFGGKGLIAAGFVVIIAGSALAAWAGLTDQWRRIAEWLVGQTPVTVGLYLLGISALLAGASHLLIRHAEP